ncbi:uncharacterized protein LOC141610545 isoform X2 [Silene latifolia]|uniref:uncharacterized protein LOC141610545 isoform X2 n=1 Tax=Silene latifolia TaxID=37657 RepID=UPI003D76CB8A
MSQHTAKTTHKEHKLRNNTKMSLPVNLVFSVNDHKQDIRYLSFTGDQKFLRFGAEEGVFTVTTKFAIEPASNGLIHIRSCYDNHYWVRYSVSQPWLSASAPEPVEDQSKDNCTLFRPEISSDAKFVRLQHVRSGLNVVMRPAGDAINAYYLCVQPSSPATVFGCINYASLVKLHKYVRIIGDNYRTSVVRTIRNKPFIQIEANGPSHDNNGFETFFTRNGNIRIKSIVPGKFLCLEQPSDTDPFSWILADYPPESDPTNPNTLFEIVVPFLPEAISPFFPDPLALRCLGNNHFCKRYTGNTIQNCLAAETKSPEDKHIALRFVNLAVQTYSDVTVKSFRHPRVYNIETEELLTNQVLENRNGLNLVAYIRKDGHIHTNKQSFSNSVNHDQSVSNFFSIIPFLTEDGQVAIPEDNKVVSLGAKRWGTTYDTSSPKDVVMSYLLPPRSRVTASLIAKTATFEVPFSYQVSERFFSNNGSATYNLDDGFFTGIYTYATQVRIDLVEPLSTNQKRSLEAEEDRDRHG